MKSQPRRIAKIIEPKLVTEGAGVKLMRSIATRTLDYLDPFLLLDHFESSNPRDYQAGFPLHPHRGIGTMTYVLRGAVHHKDTLGNSGTIGAGAVQWMTAGRGIMHEEMPQVRPEGIAGFQLWVNLPAKLKMSRLRYQDIRAAEVPEITRAGGGKIRVITGTVDGVSGPVTGIAAAPAYLDVSLPAHASFGQPIERGHAAFVYVCEGEAQFTGEEQTNRTGVSRPRLVVLHHDRDEVRLVTGERPARLLLVSGKPLREPIARYGPFVMNTQEKIEQTLLELRQGTFVPRRMTTRAELAQRRFDHATHTRICSQRPHLASRTLRLRTARPGSARRAHRDSLLRHLSLRHPSGAGRVGRRDLPHGPRP